MTTHNKENFSHLLMRRVLVDETHGAIKFAKDGDETKIITDCAALLDSWPEIDETKALKVYCRADAYDNPYMDACAALSDTLMNFDLSTHEGYYYPVIHMTKMYETDEEKTSYLSWVDGGQ